MKKDKHKTVVIFRKWKGDKQIFALFPYNYEGQYRCLSYQHIGQHDSDDYNHCINQSRPVNETEYTDLKKELENIGYNLEIKTRITSYQKMYSEWSKYYAKSQ